jgi:hypothetical protein
MTGPLSNQITNWTEGGSAKKIAKKAGKKKKAKH